MTLRLTFDVHERRWGMLIRVSRSHVGIAIHLGTPEGVYAELSAIWTAQNGAEDNPLATVARLTLRAWRWSYLLPGASR